MYQTTLSRHMHYGNESVSRDIRELKYCDPWGFNDGGSRNN
jgi:hypothetical protein